MADQENRAENHKHEHEEEHEYKLEETPIRKVEVDLTGLTPTSPEVISKYPACVHGCLIYQTSDYQYWNDWSCSAWQVYCCQGHFRSSYNSIQKRNRAKHHHQIGLR
jgi:hypothetical protein